MSATDNHWDAIREGERPTDNSLDAKRHWSLCPKLNTFAEEIGAEPVSLRRAVVRESGPRGYRRIIGTLRITLDGKVECDVPNHKLTDSQQAEFAIEIAAAKFPESVPALEANMPSQLAGVDPSEYFTFRNREGLITFIQWRRNGKDGISKSYVPLSFWDDGQWRTCEPDGLLPLYGIDRLKNAATVFLHEGPKAACVVQAMVDGKTATDREKQRKHPWGEILKHAAHIGWPGGALNPDRVDWGPIKALPPHFQVIMICDNDPPGIDAATIVSRSLKRPMTVVRFNDRFPTGFDLADNWPRHSDWWSKDGDYLGPTLHDLASPATWATKVVNTGKKGRPKIVVREEFAGEWIIVIDPPVFIHRRRPHIKLSDKLFDALVRPFSYAERTSPLMRTALSSQVDALIYRPYKEEGTETNSVMNESGRRFFNTFRPSQIKAKQGDPTPFLDFMTHLIPDESDRHELQRWIATLVACLHRMSYGVLLISETQGVGKTTLAEGILAPLVGVSNVSFPDEKAITNSDFNGWIAHKRLAIVNEIYAGHTSKAYDQLKSVVTDKTVRVNEKHMPAYELENHIHIFASSNSFRALSIHDADRRWLVPRVTDKQQPPEWWDEFHRWLAEGGLQIIRQWADDFLRQNTPVKTGEHAPMTGQKKDLIAESRSPGKQLAFELGETTVKSGDKIILAANDVRAWVAEQRGLGHSDSRLEGKRPLLNALKAAGMKEAMRQSSGETRRFKVDGGTNDYIVANFEIQPGAHWEDLKGYLRRPKDIIQASF